MRFLGKISIEGSERSSSGEIVWPFSISRDPYVIRSVASSPTSESRKVVEKVISVDIS